MADEIIVLITASNKEEAATIGTTLVAERLAACVNIVPEVRSLFFWEGKTRDEQETLLIVKSRLVLMEKLVSRVRSLHSYAVPEVIALPIVAGSTDYLGWLRENTEGK
jgi:periplasmic divalent cation tolerance protein